jgi:hypothetical protein
MSKLFGGAPKMPEIKPAPLPVTEKASEVKAQSDQQRRDAMSRKGHRKTLLARDSKPVGQKTLLG